MSQKQPTLKVILHAFGLFRGPSYERHGMTPRGMGGIEKESCGLERISGCIYVHFKAVLCFTRNKQMGCLKDFRDKTNGAKHPRNITSHFGFPRNV